MVFERNLGSGQSHIYVVNADGTGLRQLTSGKGNDSEPVYAPSGKRILFTSNRDHDVRTDRSDIFAMGPGGENMRVLIDGPRNESEPDPSPNGRAIAFVSNRAPGINIFVAGASGAHVRQPDPQPARLLQWQLQPEPGLVSRRQAHRLPRGRPLQQRPRGDARKRDGREGVRQRLDRRRRLRQLGRPARLGPRALTPLKSCPGIVIPNGNREGM